MTELSAALDRVVSGASHWTPSAWSAAAPGMADASRAQAVHGLVQRLADLTADAESGPRRPVPRLDNDLALTDQLRVVATDLLAARPAPPTLAAATDTVRNTHRALWP